MPPAPALTLFGAVERHDEVAERFAALGEIVELIVGGASGRQQHDRLPGIGPAASAAACLDGASERAALDMVDAVPELAGKSVGRLPDQIGAGDPAGRKVQALLIPPLSAGRR